MSYCVQCGVELDSTAERCPLCGTPVYNPNQPVDRTSPPPFPAIRQEVAPIDRRELAVAVTAVLSSASVFCVLLNLIRHRLPCARCSAKSPRCSAPSWR
ncbi:zinc-ribbon domain-containing protein [Fournierella sp.]|uniref:zinc-ribbon domain-containing protein n=1 Tax=Allofournierella sp. TaxID=1940256 RepID=UPI0025BC2E78|nr:zinc-ribbon domain-containing protein [Fournierella sp.]